MDNVILEKNDSRHHSSRRSVLHRSLLPTHPLSHKERAPYFRSPLHVSDKLVSYGPV